MRSTEEIVEHMHALDADGRQATGGVFYAACNNTTIEFVDRPDGAYGNVAFCAFKQQLDCADAMSAQRLVDEMNQGDGTCSACGKRAKYRLFTEDDYQRRATFCKMDEKSIKR